MLDLNDPHQNGKAESAVAYSGVAGSAGAALGAGGPWWLPLLCAATAALVPLFGALSRFGTAWLALRRSELVADRVRLRAAIDAERNQRAAEHVRYLDELAKLRAEIVAHSVRSVAPSVGPEPEPQPEPEPPS